MINNPHLNGCDYLMLGFDHELRRRGFAGNACQIALELSSKIDPAALRARLEKMVAHFPILTARPGGLIFPHWQEQRDCLPQVRVHRGECPLAEIVNEPLAIPRGELLRFDLMERGQGMRVVLSWAHAVMDAPGAEYFLALLGCADLPWPNDRAPIEPRESTKLAERGKLAWKYIHHLDELCLKPPRTLGVRHPAAAPRLHHRVELFSAEETVRARAQAVRHAGLLGDAQFHAAAAAMELHRLHVHLGSPSPSYVLPLPVGLRAKGSMEPLFGNQVSMLMIQFLPEDLETIGSAVATLRRQIAEGMRAGLLHCGLTLGHLFRFLPIPAYMALVKRGLRGEIGSLFYGHTGAVNPRLTHFLGAPIDDVAHVAAITPSPGIGTVFYYFQNRLHLTVEHLLPMVSDVEAEEFATGLRRRLLES